MVGMEVGEEVSDGMGAAVTESVDNEACVGNAVGSGKICGEFGQRRVMVLRVLAGIEG